jgi:hypothetical protein
MMRAKVIVGRMIGSRGARADGVEGGEEVIVGRIGLWEDAAVVSRECM